MSAPRVCPIDIGQSMVEELTAGLEARAEVDDSRDRCADSTTVGCSPDYAAACMDNQAREMAPHQHAWSAFRLEMFHRLSDSSSVGRSDLM